MLFGRAFEQGLAAYFRREDSTVALCQHWTPYRDVSLEYSKGETWDSMLQQGIKLLEFFAQHDRVRIPRPGRNLQIKFSHSLGKSTEFVAYIDAIGELDGERTIIDWKTTTMRYPEEPDGLLALDPQLASYSWITGEPNVAFVVFVRKRLPEIQYLHTTISEQQRAEFGELLLATIRRIEGAGFLPHSGIRFPQNGCVSCPYLGLCLGKNDLVEAQLTRRAGGELAWLDQLDY